MTTENIQRILDNNGKYAASFSGGELSVLPSRLCCLVTCHDSRIDPALAFGIDIGQFHVIRNAGGNVKDALRSILISQHMLSTREVILVKHTDCGTASFTNEGAHQTIARNQGEGAVPADFDFLPFVDPEASVREEVAWLRSLKALLKGTVVSGLVYNVRTGKVKQIVSARHGDSVMSCRVIVKPIRGGQHGTAAVLQPCLALEPVSIYRMVTSRLELDRLVRSCLGPSYRADRLETNAMSRSPVFTQTGFIYI